MPWLDNLLDCLARQPVCGYHSGGGAAVEPTALAAMALAAHGRIEAAATAVDWLVRVQLPDGAVGISAMQDHPHWPTGWALLAWQSAEAHGGRLAEPARRRWSAAAECALAWLLNAKGETSPRSEVFGHDTTLMGWPWVDGTHCWVEPTAIGLLALKSRGAAGHPRCREAVRLLVDRALPSGGWNYGNTVVFGTPLRPHVQPTGLALAALAREQSAAGPRRSALARLQRMVSSRTTPVSLCYALLGMARHGVWPASADAWLAAAAARAMDGGGPGYPLALAALASRREECGWFSEDGG
jgi:hypothetical protein